MKLSFGWRSGHPGLHIRLLMADGESVAFVTRSGSQFWGPLVRNGQVLAIADTSVAYGSEARWSLRVFVDDCPTETRMTGLTVVAIYDDTVEPAKREALCAGETVPPNTPVDFDKVLTVPEKRE